MAVMLRKKFGASEVLRDLYRYGIENLTLNQMQATPSGAEFYLSARIR